MLVDLDLFCLILAHSLQKIHVSENENGVSFSEMQCNFNLLKLAGFLPLRAGRRLLACKTTVCTMGMIVQFQPVLCDAFETQIWSATIHTSTM